MIKNQHVTFTIGIISSKKVKLWKNDLQFHSFSKNFAEIVPFNFIVTFCIFSVCRPKKKTGSSQRNREKVGCLLSAPLHVGKYRREAMTDFLLPYDIWWLHVKDLVNPVLQQTVAFLSTATFHCVKQILFKISSVLSCFSNSLNYFCVFRSFLVVNVHIGTSIILIMFKMIFQEILNVKIDCKAPLWSFTQRNMSLKTNEYRVFHFTASKVHAQY